jgi:hypothetical protein
MEGGREVGKEGGKERKRGRERERGRQREGFREKARGDKQQLSPSSRTAYAICMYIYINHASLFLSSVSVSLFSDVC